MSVIADLYADAQHAPSMTVTQAVAGPRFTALLGAPVAPKASPPVCGLAYTGVGESDPAFDGAQASARLSAQVKGQPLAAVARTLQETPTDYAAAALNALLSARRLRERTVFGDENGLDLIAERSAGKRLAVVGAFPYLQTIRVEAAQSWVLELEPEDDQLPASAAPDVIPQADVVGITGSTLANGTLEGLLALCRRDAFVVVIGPTTPLSPVLFDYGVSVLCGSVCDDPAQVLASVATDRSTRRLPGMRQVSLRRA